MRSPCGSAGRDIELKRILKSVPSDSLHEFRMGAELQA